MTAEVQLPDNRVGIATGELHVDAVVVPPVAQLREGMTPAHCLTGTFQPGEVADKVAAAVRASLSTGMFDNGCSLVVTVQPIYRIATPQSERVQ